MRTTPTTLFLSFFAGNELTTCPTFEEENGANLVKRSSFNGRFVI